MTKSWIAIKTKINILFGFDHNQGKLDIARPVRIELI